MPLFSTTGYDDRLDVLAQPAALRLGRRLDALAGGVELPAVERAAQAVGLDAAVGQVGAAVRAVALHQAIPEFCLVQDEVLGEKPHRLDRPLALHLVHQRHRLPVAAQQLAGRRARPDARHQLVLLAANHATRGTGQRAHRGQVVEREQHRLAVVRAVPVARPRRHAEDVLLLPLEALARRPRTSRCRRRPGRSSCRCGESGLVGLPDQHRRSAPMVGITGPPVSGLRVLEHAFLLQHCGSCRPICRGRSGE